MTFGVDIDEVLRALLPSMVKIYNERFHVNLAIEDVKEYDVEKSFPLIKERLSISPKQWFFHNHARELFFKTPAIKGAREALKILSDYGEVIIITRQFGTENKIYALEWLEKFKMPYDGICFVNDKSVIKCDYLIDDNVDNFKHCDIKGAVLITAPYNKSEEDVYRLHTICNAGCFQRFDSILEFAYDFKETHSYLKRKTI